MKSHHNNDNPQVQTNIVQNNCLFDTIIEQMRPIEIFSSVA